MKAILRTPAYRRISLGPHVGTLQEGLNVNQSPNAERIADESRTRFLSRFVHRNILYFNHILTIRMDRDPLSAPRIAQSR